MADAYGLGVDEGQDRPPRGRRRREDLPDPAVRRGPVFGRIHHHDRDEGLEAELEPRPSRGRGRDGDADMGRPRTEGAPPTWRFAASLNASRPWSGISKGRRKSKRTARGTLLGLAARIRPATDRSS